ncbi:hypothetical protein KUA24_9 [Vibrio phage HNL01]|nr:hypothetical protein KUA24_9 [Vibrio phage HNL01]
MSNMKFTNKNNLLQIVTFTGLVLVLTALYIQGSDATSKCVELGNTPEQCEKLNN